MTAPLLVFGWGNPSRGDDALGPMCIERLQQRIADECVEFITDFQLQIEHGLDLIGRNAVLFVDADASIDRPYQLTEISACRDTSLSTHALSPQAVMQVFADLTGLLPPPCALLVIRGETFELGMALSIAAREALAQALPIAQDWITRQHKHTPLSA